MSVTIKDVAKLAGVAPSTVTRVIQNKSTISDETKKRVREAMVELDYHPNLNARSLVSQSSQVIALVLPIDSDVFYQNPFFPTVLRGITQIASDNDYAIQICTGQNEERRRAIGGFKPPLFLRRGCGSRSCACGPACIPHIPRRWPSSARTCP